MISRSRSMALPPTSSLSPSLSPPRSFSFLPSSMSDESPSSTVQGSPPKDTSLVHTEEPESMASVEEGKEVTSTDGLAPLRAPSSPTNEKRHFHQPPTAPSHSFHAPPLTSAPTLKDLRHNSADLQARRMRSRTLSMSKDPAEMSLGRALSRVISP